MGLLIPLFIVIATAISLLMILKNSVDIKPSTVSSNGSPHVVPSSGVSIHSPPAIPEDSSEIADWETYTPGHRLFTIKYPPILTIKDARFYPVTADTLSLGYVFDIYLDRSREAVEEFDLIFNLAPGEKIKSTHAAEAYIYKTKNLNVSAYPAIEYIDDRSTTALVGGGTSYARIVKINTGNGIVGLLNFATKQASWNKVFTQMISTIEFPEE